MDTISLVDEQVESGRRLLEQLSAADFPVRAACWAKPADEDRWSLYVASPAVDKKGVTSAYREVFRVLRSIENSWVTDSDVKLIGEGNSVTSGILDIQKRYPGRMATRSRRPLLGDLPVDEVYIYPPAMASAP
jgi:hypothetical protein